MLLVSYQYEEHANDPSQAWDVQECTFSQVNLIVGRNASGKSRTLTTIQSLVKIINGKIPVAVLASGTFKITLSDSFGTTKRKKPNLLIYSLQLENGQIKNETLTDGKKNLLLTRDIEGKGYLPGKEIERDINFEIKGDQLALSARRDKLQHPFLEPIFDWAETFRFYKFSASRGQELGFVQVSQSQEKFKDDWDEPLGAAIAFANELYSDDFTETICKYMQTLGYPITWLGLRPLNVPNQHNQGLITTVSALEDDRNGYVDQTTFSTGMYRALTVLVRCELAKRADKPFTVIIDDIGEGLDFERSKVLIEILISFTETKKIQLLMSTNDRFVMNTVPIEYWSILERTGSHVSVFNKENHKKTFEEFEAYGFNNFDFFSRKYFNSDIIH